MSTPKLNRSAALGFAKSGYTVVRNLVPAAQLTEVLAAVDSLLDQQPLPDGHTGHHFYWRNREDGPEAIFQLMRDKLLAAAEAFVALVRRAGLIAGLRQVRALCLSGAVADAARGIAWREVCVAARPDQTVLLDLIGR